MANPNPRPRLDTHNPRSKAGQRFLKIYRPVYHAFGFQKGYNFPFYFITVGTLFGFVLARMEYLDFVGTYLKVSTYSDHSLQIEHRANQATIRTRSRASNSGIVQAIVASAFVSTLLAFSLADYLPVFNLHPSSATSSVGSIAYAAT